MNYLYTAILLGAFLLLVAVPGPESLRGIVLGGMLVAVLLLIPVRLVFTGTTSADDPRPVANLCVIGVSAAILTGLFWFRATVGPLALESGLSLRITKTLFFWVPAVLVGVMYRSAGEGWLPSKRRAVLIRMLVAFVGSLVGLMAHETARGYIDATPMAYAVRHVERQLPGNESRLDYHADGRTLHLNVVLDPGHEESNLQRLRRIRAIAHHAAGLARRVDTDSVSLRVLRSEGELASLGWPDPETNRPLDRLQINYATTDLSDLPTAEDLDELLDLPQPSVRPENLTVELEGTTLVLLWIGPDIFPDQKQMTSAEPTRIPELTAHWRAASRLVVPARSIYPGLEVFRFAMPGYQLQVRADSVRAGFSAPRQLPRPERSVTLQIYNSEQMPDLERATKRGPVRIVEGDGQFDTRQRRTRPLWPWEAGIVGGFEFHITEVRDDGSVTFVMHPRGEVEAGRWVTLQPGEMEQIFSRYVRSVP